MDELLAAVKYYRSPEMMVYGIEEFERVFKIKFVGVGWYYGKHDTLLILPSHADTMVRVWHWPGLGKDQTDPMNMFRWIVEAPVRIEQRK